MKNRSFLGLNILRNLYFIKFRQNSGSSEADDVSEASEPSGESCFICSTSALQIVPLGGKVTQSVLQF